MGPQDDDVLENEPRRPRRGPMAFAAAVCVVALAVLAFVRLGADDDRDADDRPPVTARPLPVTSAPAWPTVRGACGADVEVPLLSSVELRETTGLQVLTGGARLTRVDVDSGSSTVLGGSSRTRQFHALVSHGRDAYASAESGCDIGAASVLRVRGSDSPRPLDLPDVGDVIAGAAGAWAVDYPRDPDGRVVLRAVAGAGTVTLPKRAQPFGVSAAGVVATLRGDEVVDEATIVLLDADTGRLARTIGRGVPWAVGADSVLWTGEDCEPRPVPSASSGPGRTCVLRSTTLSGSAEDATYWLPEGRVPTSRMVLGRDGRRAAFQLSRTEPERRYSHQHPLPESDVVVLDLDTSRLHVVPGLVLAPKTGVGLAFSLDGRWLVLATNHGDNGNLFVWRPGVEQLLRSPAFLAGPLVGTVPVLVTN